MNLAKDAAGSRLAEGQSGEAQSQCQSERCTLQLPGLEVFTRIHRGDSPWFGPSHPGTRNFCVFVASKVDIPEAMQALPIHMI
jgi:hypothetical protein